MDIVIIVSLVVFLSSAAAARELRPSEHGLIYQTETPSPAENAPSQSGSSSSEMKKFFGGGMTTTSTELPLPKAMNSSDPAWMNATERRRKAGKGDHVKEVLLVASLVCGITGGVFLLIAGFVFLFRFKAKNKDHHQVDKPVVEQPSPSQPITTSTASDKKISDILSN